MAGAGKAQVTIAGNAFTLPHART